MIAWLADIVIRVSPFLVSALLFGNDAPLRKMRLQGATPVDPFPDIGPSSLQFRGNLAKDIASPGIEDKPGERPGTAIGRKQGLPLLPRIARPSLVLSSGGARLQLRHEQTLFCYFSPVDMAQSGFIPEQNWNPA